MKTREELEIMFEQKYWDDMLNRGELKQFIFDTIIPEVLKSILGLDEGTGYLEDDLNNYLKQKAKELYGIDL